MRLILAAVAAVSVTIAPNVKVKTVFENFNLTVKRVIDFDTNVVCYVTNSSISCLPYQMPKAEKSP